MNIDLPSIGLPQILNEFSKMGHAYILHLFIILVLLDITIGTVKGFLTHKMDSSIGTKGLIKHGILIFTVLIVYYFADLAGFRYLAQGYIFWAGAQYANSCIESWCQMGLPFPRQWRTHLNKLTNDDGSLKEFENVIKKGRF